MLVALRGELGKPFEHEQRLTALLVRQGALAADLDLNKDEAGTQGLEAFRRIHGSLTLPLRPHLIRRGADFLGGYQVLDAAVDCRGIVVVAASIGRSRSDDPP